MSLQPKAPRILLILGENQHWRHARSWPYNLHLGIEEALQAAGAAVTTIITTWLTHWPKLCPSQRFDQIWVVDLIHIHSHPVLPWHVNRAYDFLRTCPVPEKTRQLSWITSNLQMLAGHQARMAFLQQVKGKLPFDLWGRGFTPLTDKWDGLAPYRYAIAVENYSNPWYWSEKVGRLLLGLVYANLLWLHPNY